MTAQEQGILAFIHALDQNGLHAPEIRQRIVPEVNDKRQKPAEPLPAFAAREIELH
jgi:hypothetical protein